LTVPRWYTNTSTDKMYFLTKAEEKGFELIKAKLRPDKDWGSVKWKIEEKKFILYEIQSHPEEGSGLGSLLMYLAAVEATEAHCEVMEILNAAQRRAVFT
jgi:hypothetical protein